MIYLADFLLLKIGDLSSPWSGRKAEVLLYVDFFFVIFVVFPARGRHRQEPSGSNPPAPLRTQLIRTSLSAQRSNRRGPHQEK